MESIKNPQFPKSAFKTFDERNQSKNLALQIFGRRFLADQTPIEYLAEFLLVFNSAKSNSQHRKIEESDENAVFGANSFSVTDDTGYYLPKTRLPLKFFSFFSQSKLETRHPLHQQSFSESLALLESKIDKTLSEYERQQLVQSLQILLSGFVGVANNRTWSTYSFMPITPSLLGREITWSHNSKDYASWEDSGEGFAVSDHNFMARGGEVLFLQIAYVFSNTEKVQNTLAQLQAKSCYQSHLEFDLVKLQTELETQLKKLLTDETKSLEELSQFIEITLAEYDIPNKASNPASLATIPTEYIIEGFLFANELVNLLKSEISKLEKIELLQQLCVMQVLRSIMARSRQLDSDVPITPNFYGNYAWIVSNRNALPNEAVRKLSESSFNKSEEIIYRIIRASAKYLGVALEDKDYKQIDKHSFDVFRKMAKNIEFVVPLTGSNQRFILTPSLIRLFVYSLIKPSERIKLTDFLQRIYAHFGIALEGEQLQEATTWQLENNQDTIMSVDISWVEEGLKQSGLLIELSDAVSIVVNP